MRPCAREAREAKTAGHKHERTGRRTSAPCWCAASSSCCEGCFCCEGCSPVVQGCAVSRAAVPAPRRAHVEPNRWSWRC